MAGEHWYRVHHGAPLHRKWRVIANMAREMTARSCAHCERPWVTISDVVSVVFGLLDIASQAPERGRVWERDETQNGDETPKRYGNVSSVTPVTERFRRFIEIATAFDMPLETVHAIGKSLEQHRVIVSGRFRNWEKYQPKREDSRSSARVRAFRERQKNETAGNARSRGDETHGNARGEERREEENKERISPQPPSGGETDGSLLNGHARSPKRERKKPGLPVPADFAPDATDYQTGTELGLSRVDVMRAVGEFVDYWRGTGKLMADWHATFRNRLRQIAERRGTSPASGAGMTIAQQVAERERIERDEQRKN